MSAESFPTRTEQEREFVFQLGIVRGVACADDRAQQYADFPAWAPRQSIARFLAAYEIYKHILDVHGVVIEGGIGGGAGLFGWGHMASVLEPFNYTRKVIGFDFGADAEVRRELERLAVLHDQNRPVGHIPRVEFVWGDATQTIPVYVEAHPELVIALVVLDFTTHEPTRKAAELLIPLVASGGVIVAGGIWPDEMRVFERGLPWRRCPWSSTLIWAVKP